MKITKAVALFFLCSLALSLFSQEKYTISGSITDVSTGEELLGATVYIKEKSTGTTTNRYGFYSLTLPKGTYSIEYGFIGYQPTTREVDLSSPQQLNIELSPKSTTLQEVEITSTRKNENVETVEMSTVNMQMETIKKIPAFMGEVDIIKAIQLLPGVQTVGEGTSGIYVRGGGVDQNLVLLDEATVYNAAHFLGFFSVFNSDAIKDVQLYKGGIPPRYGGRLSSVVDVRMNEGNLKQLKAKGGIGSISSRLTVEGPIKKDKSSFIVSARRTYADVFLKLSSDTNAQKTKLYFYDLNAKANYKINDKNRIFLSGYLGRDVFGFADQFEMGWGNATATLRWNHIFNDRLFSNATLIYSNFDYSLGVPQGVEAFLWESNIQDYSAKLDFSYFINPNNTVRFGAQTTLHDMDPGFARGVGDESIFNELNLTKSYALEHGIYVSNEQKISPRLSFLYGLRFSALQNIGEATQYNFDENFLPLDSTVYEKGEVFNEYGGLEPRAGLKYTLTTESSIKLSYNRTRQYIHLASNSTSSSPLDIWFLSSPNVKPQIADQIAAGYFRNFSEDLYEASAEVYYKKMDNAIDFKNHAELLLNPQLEGELRFGQARAYGLELFLKKREGRLTGWVSYTLSRTERLIPDITEDWYPTRYDKTHDASVVASYELNDRWQLGGTWVYSTGAAVTMPTGRFEYFGTITPVYSERNAARLPAYHRLDLSATYRRPVKEGRRWQSEWVFSVFNVYFRKNTFAINFRQDPEDPNTTFAEKVYLFPVIPSVTYNFEF